MRRNARTGNLPHGPPGQRCWALLGAVALLAGACADDTTAMTDTAQGSTTMGTTESPTTSPPTTVDPTTEDVPTTTESVTSTTTTTGPTTTEPTTTDSTTTTTSTTDTDTTDTDTTTGAEVMGRSVTQTVNSGTVATSLNFRMVFTMGQPTQNQGIYTSDNFRLQGGLIGANGNPP